MTLPSLGSRSHAKPQAATSVFIQVAQGIDQGIAVPRWQQNAGFSVANQVPELPDVRGNDCPPCSHVFQHLERRKVEMIELGIRCYSDIHCMKVFCNMLLCDGTDTCDTTGKLLLQFLQYPC